MVGDAADAPTSKAGSVVHFEAESFVPNFLAHLQGKEPTESFDGHANCFIESGGGKALLLDFNYETEPLPGKFPVPAVGPLTLLGESRFNHLGKLSFQEIYWRALIPGIPIPLAADMSLAGKDVSQLTKEDPAPSGPPIPTF